MSQYTTRDDVKTSLGIPASVTADDAAIDAAIAAAIARKAHALGSRGRRGTS